MCMTFGCNPQINFCHFLAVGTYSFFGSTFYQSLCERNSSYNFSGIFFKLCTKFADGFDKV